MNPIWLPASLFGGLFQAWRTALQQRLRAELSVSGAGLVRYLYGLPFAALFAAIWLWAHPVAMPALGPAFLGFALVGAVTQMAGTILLILAFGSMLQPCLAAGESLGAAVANMRFVKPLDEALVVELAERHDLLVTVEENVVAGGAGSAVVEALERNAVSVPVLQLGLPDRFVDQGDPALQLASCGLTADGILQSIRDRLAVLTPSIQPKRMVRS